MRRGGLLCLVTMLLAAQSPAQEPRQALSDVPAGPGTIRGRIVHQEDPQRPLGGIALVLYALSRNGLAGARRGASEADGRFGFEGVSNDPSTSYLIAAEYQGVPYPGAPLRFPPGALEREIEIRVAEVTTEARDVSVPSVRLRTDWQGRGLRVIESLTIRNASPHTVYVPAEARGTGVPALRVHLPVGAEQFAMPHAREPEGVVHRDGEVAFWGPLYPGEQDLRFSYLIPASGETVEIAATFPSGAERIEVLIPDGGGTPSGERLVEKEAQVFDGRSFRIFERTDLAPGERLALSLRVPEARIDPDALEMAEVRLILNVDDAALDVREHHVLEVEGDTGVTAAEGSSLLEIHVPEDSESLRVASDAAGLVLERLPGGGVAVGGVAPPGESTVQVSYRVPVRGSSIDLIRSFEREVPLLGILLADTGRLITESDRLHRRRPVRTDDLTYIHLEAFRVAAGEEVPLRISARPPRRGSAQGSVTALALLAGLGAAALLLTPLFGRDVGADDAAVEELPSVRERESIYAAIRDLEHDHETGKITESDYGSMREELRARAVALLRREREGAVVAQEGSASPRCPSCEAEVRAGDRFCSRCGEALFAGREDGANP